MLVAGQAGIGKSRLVAEALRQAASPVVWGSCWQGDGAPAFWPWTQVIRECVGSAAGAAWRDGRDASVDEVVALLPGEGRPASIADASRFRLFDGVTRLVQAVAAGEGLAVVFDDLQWVDEGSARLLGFAVRALHDQPVVFVGTYRDDEVGPDHPVSMLLAELAGRVRHVALTGLDADGLSLLARRAAGPRRHARGRAGSGPASVDRGQSLLRPRGARTDPRPSASLGPSPGSGGRAGRHRTALGAALQRLRRHVEGGRRHRHELLAQRSRGCDGAIGCRRVRSARRGRRRPDRGGRPRHAWWTAIRARPVARDDLRVDDSGEPGCRPRSGGRCARGPTRRQPGGSDARPPPHSCHPARRPGARRRGRDARRERRHGGARQRRGGRVVRASAVAHPSRHRRRNRCHRSVAGTGRRPVAGK